MTDTQILEQMCKDILALTAERDDARSNSAELQALFDMQHSRVREAEQLWWDRHPGNDLVKPDLGELVQWLMDDRAGYKSDAERLAEALKFYATSDGWLFEWNDDYPDGITTKKKDGIYLDTGQIARAALAAHERGEG